MLDFLRKDPAARLKRVFKHYDLPSFPKSITAALAAIRQPNSSADKIARAMAADPGLSVRVLRLANSATFSPIRRVDNLSQAIALIGMSQLELLILNVGVKSQLPVKPMPGYHPHKFWRLAAFRAALAFNLGQQLEPVRKCASFTAGYLQDLAIPLLIHYRGKDYSGLLQSYAVEGDKLVEQERNTFQWDHAQVARWICEFWKIPEGIAEEIGGHHGGADGYQEPASAPVRLAAIFSTIDFDSYSERFIEQARCDYGLPPDISANILLRSIEQAEELARLMN